MNEPRFERSIVCALAPNFNDNLPCHRSPDSSCVVLPRPARLRPKPLELVPQRELHRACRRDSLKLPEGQRRNQRQAGVREVHIVESVERLRAELHALAFPRELDRLRKREIRVEERRQAQDRARAAVPWKLVRERTGRGRVAEYAGNAVLVDLYTRVYRLSDDSQ